ncbi:MAG: hypothetical protein JO186_08835 [Actinobacteria bacterium]|nr:hypothetical protein [Actinomycetota bacterium]MBV8397076.1 hypothetical protein [Actinomycetota bacterium]
MSLFLLTFHRGEREEPILERFDDPDLAMKAFGAAERLHRERGDGYGVVLLIAEDEEALRRTHTHYFEGVEEMLGAFSR